jgi:polyhydroxyalkanoate synthesis regulator phasin
MKKLIASIAIAAALGGGAFALNTVLPAGAQTDSGTQSQTGPAGAHPRGERAKAALDKLVQDGTITQAQEDAVIQALKDALPRDGRGELRERLLRAAIKVSAETIGITPQELRAELQAGKSIAEVAAEHNVSVDDVKQALVDAATAKINEAVANGRITQERADNLIERLPALVERVVNHHKGDGPAAD